MELVVFKPVALKRHHHLRELPYVGRFHQEGIRAERIGRLEIVPLVGGGQHDYRNRRQILLLTNPFQHVHAAQTGELEIEQDQARPGGFARLGVGIASLQVVERLGSVDHHMKRIGNAGGFNRPLHEEDVVIAVFHEQVKEVTPPDPELLIVAVTDMQSKDQFDSFLNFMVAHEGTNVVTFKTPDGSVELTNYPTGITMEHAGRVSLLLGGASVRQKINATTDQLSEGLEL